jgi:hypothetical protein
MLNVNNGLYVTNSRHPYPDVPMAVAEYPMANLPFHSHKHGLQEALLFSLLIGTFLAVGAYYGTSISPEVGAQVAQTMRDLVGDQAVAFIENTYFQLQDTVTKWQYQMGWVKPTTPWLADESPASSSASVSSAPSSGHGKAYLLLPDPSPTVNPTRPPTPTPTVSPTMPPTPTSTAIPTWPPASLPSLGNLPMVGQWTPYLTDSSGRIVAYRTFLQPDSSRPYAVVAIVAFDLTATQLNFVLGSVEPTSDILVPRSGAIPEVDNRPGKLLATFNGGFKAQHGHFGAMVNGVIILPPRAGLGTVALYSDGTVRIGEWGVDILASPNMVAWRQNGPLIIHNGAINPHTADTAPLDWGYTVKGAVAVWRSSLGINRDGTILYYAAGPNLTLPSLATAMSKTGATQAMQLDINNYWVHFDSIHFDGYRAIPTHLVPGMKGGIGRYLLGYTRDFFYVTSK